MAKKKNTDFTGVSVLIRNMEASFLYYLGTEQNEEHKKVVTDYCALCSKHSKLNREIKDIKDEIGKNKPNEEQLEKLQKLRIYRILA